jgi:hypothetical protein
MTHFDASQPAATAANDLLQQVVDLGGRQLHAYLCCGNSNGINGSRIYCLHFPTKFLLPLDRQPSLWDNTNFAFPGEVLQGQVTTVVFPTTAFDVFTARVKSLDYMVQHLDDLTPATPLFPPELPEAADTEEQTVQQFCYLPAVYVPLLLSAGGYTVRQVWERVSIHAYEEKEKTIHRRD